MQVEKCMLVTWCGSPVVIPGVGGGGRCIKTGSGPYHRPPEVIHLPPNGVPRASYRYGDQIVSYDPLVHSMDLYRSNLVLNAPVAQKDLIIKCPPLRRHSHDQSDFNAELFNLNNMNNLNKAKSCHNTPRKTKYPYKDEQKLIKSNKENSKEELSRSRSILRRSASNWYRRKPRNCNQHRLSLPSLQDSSKHRAQTNYSSTSELNKVKRSSTSVGDCHRKSIVQNINNILSNSNNNLRKNNDSNYSFSPIRNGQKRTAAKNKRVSINLNETINPHVSFHSLPRNDMYESIKNKNILDNGNSLYSSLSSGSSSSSGSTANRHSSLHNRTLAKIRGLQR